MPAPYLGKEFTFKQPDGTDVKVKGWGNQNNAIFETLDGYLVIKDPNTGYFQYAQSVRSQNKINSSGIQVNQVNPTNLGLLKNSPVSKSIIQNSIFSNNKSRWKTRREISKMQQRTSVLTKSGLLAAPPKQHTVGKIIGLCILIDFPDVESNITQAEVEKFCNLKGYKGFNNNGSVYDYFQDNSDGKLEYTSIVTPYYTAKYDKDYYTDESIEDGARAQELIIEALDHFKSIGFFDNLTNDGGLSTDSEGYVFATNIFYAGNVENNWSKGLWPHSWSLYSRYRLKRNMYVYDYQITDIGYELELGTFCHENGHMICDFPDLYDYGKDRIASYGVGAFCLMCAGSNIDPKNPTQISAYLKYKAGWSSNVVEISGNSDATIEAGKNEFYIYRKNLYEYFIIENRIGKYRDKSLPSTGIAIWHVDELGNNENQNMTSLSHYECSLVAADGNYDFENSKDSEYGDKYDLFYDGEVNEFGRQDYPSNTWWDGSESGLVLTDISVSKDIMSFKITL